LHCCYRRPKVVSLSVRFSLYGMQITPLIFATSHHRVIHSLGSCSAAGAALTYSLPERYGEIYRPPLAATMTRVGQDIPWFADLWLDSEEGLAFVCCRIRGNHRRVISGRHLSSMASTEKAKWTKLFDRFVARARWAPRSTPASPGTTKAPRLNLESIRKLLNVDV
jgi:hypothetical protein